MLNCLNSSLAKLSLRSINRLCSAIIIHLDRVDRNIKDGLLQKHNVHKIASYVRLIQKEVRILTDKVSK